MGPEIISNEEHLDDLMTLPSHELINTIHWIKSPLVILGASGKMGPSLAVLTHRAAEQAGIPLEVVTVSRFSDDSSRIWLEDNGIHTIRCNLMDPGVYSRLPDSGNIIYLVDLTFGTRDDSPLTWATNTLIPAMVSNRYPGTRMVVLSSGNVYPMVPISSRGSFERDPLTPQGEYSNSLVARERLFEYHSIQNKTSMVIIRQGYALDLRYGILVDIAARVYSGQPVPINTSYFNAIWQRDANEYILRSFSHVRIPPRAINITGVEKLSTRSIALQFGELMNVPVHFIGEAAETALLMNTDIMASYFGLPPTKLNDVIRWTADWVARGGRSLNKPTHYEIRDGRY